MRVKCNRGEAQADIELLFRPGKYVEVMSSD